MQIHLYREDSLDGKTSLGRFFIDGHFICDTLEDIPRDVKEKGRTCIPLGTYPVVLTFSNRFKKVMPEIMNVPGFSGIRIHAGNTAEDTDGCILLGARSGPDRIVRSMIHFMMFMAVLRPTLAREKVWITISRARPSDRKESGEPGA